MRFFGKLSKSFFNMMPIILGLSFYWLFLRRPFLGSLFGRFAEHSQECHWLYILATAGAAIALFRYGRKIEMLSARRRNIVIFSICLLAAIFSFLFSMAPKAMWPIAFTSMLLISSSFVLLTHAWVSVLILMPSRDVLAMCLTSFILTCIVSALFLLPAPYSSLLSVAAPLLSCACLFRKDLYGEVKVSETSLGIFSDFPKAFWLLALFLLLGSVLRGLLYGGSIDYLSAMSTIAPSCIAALMVFFLLPTVLHSGKDNGMFSKLWMGVAILFFFGLLLLVVAGERRVEMGRSVVIASRTGLNVLFLAYLCMGNFAKKRGAYQLASAFLIVDSASSFASYMAVPFFMRNAPGTAESYIVPCAAIVSFVLVFASYGVLGRRLFEEDDQRRGYPSSSEDFLSGLALECGLTNREKEIVLLLSEGNTVKRISELLYIAPSTVQSHMKNVYRKLNVHSRQEIIDLLKDGNAESMGDGRTHG